MKIKLFILGVVAGIIFLNSCNDDMGLVGPSIQPDDDIPSVFIDSFMIQASTVLLDSIYAKTATGLLGEIYDPLYGNLKSDYICQFYSPDGFTFSQTPIDGKIDSVEFVMFYNRGYLGGWIGDSLAVMTATAYPVNKPLDRYYYTNINPADYADMSQPLGMQTYTARNLEVSDSLWNATTSSGFSYTPRVKVRLPLELGQKFYDESVNNPASFENQEAFNRFFPGLYVTNTFGSGNILTVDGSGIQIHYSYLVENHLGVLDSVLTTSEVFSVTKEVIQMNRFQNTDISDLLQPNDEYTYLKTPAGVFTRLTIPAKDIISKIEGRIVNNFSFSLRTMPQEDWKYSLAPPSYLLLLPEDSLSNFFENGSLDNNTTIYASTAFNADSLKYTFGNISRLLKNQAEKDPDKDLNMLVIPVEREFTKDYYGNNTTTSSAIRHYLRPSGVRIRKDKDAMIMSVITSKYNDSK